MPRALGGASRSWDAQHLRLCRTSARELLGLVLAQIAADQAKIDLESVHCVTIQPGDVVVVGPSFARSDRRGMDDRVPVGEKSAARSFARQPLPTKLAMFTRDAATD